MILKHTTEHEEEFLTMLARKGSRVALRGWLYAATHYRRDWLDMNVRRLIAHARALLASGTQA